MFFPQRFQVLSNFPKVSSYQNVNYLFFALVCEPALENYLRPRKTLGERSEPKVSKLFRPRLGPLLFTRFFHDRDRSQECNERFSQNILRVVTSFINSTSSDENVDTLKYIFI